MGKRVSRYFEEEGEDVAYTAVVTKWLPQGADPEASYIHMYCMHI